MAACIPQPAPAESIMAEFARNLVKWASKFLPDFGIVEKELIEQFSPLASLCSGLEDVSAVFLEVEQVQEIAPMLGKVLNVLKGTPRGDYRRLVLDILVFACLIPYQMVAAPKSYYSLYSYTTALSRFAVRAISPSLAEALLRETQGIVSFGDSGTAHIDCSRTALLSHLDLEHYRSASLLQRMTWLSLAHLVTSVRTDLLNEQKTGESLFWRVMKSPHLGAWMLACSNADEQYFLNTCDIAASLSSIVSLHPNIASLLLLARHIYAAVQGRMPLASGQLPAHPVLFGSAPSQRDYSESCLRAFKESLDKIEDDAIALLDAEHAEAPNAQLKDANEAVAVDQLTASRNSAQTDMKMVLARHELITRWHKQMQLLSSVFFPESPVVLTPKVFANDWHKSAKWMTASAIFDQLLPGRPTFLCRSQASRTLEQISCYRLHTQLALIESEADKGLWLEFPWTVEEAESPEIQRSILTALWRRILLLDGALISSRESLFFGYWTIGHLSYWKAIRLGSKDTEKFFLISDPELSYFKLLSIDQAVSFVINLKNLVNPTDGTVIQHYRTLRLRNEDR